METLSRLTIEECGFPEPVLQYPIQSPVSGRIYRLDMYWPEFDIGGEADGAIKYREGGAEAILAEKRREDSIRGSVRSFVRWGWTDAWAREPLRRSLLDAGLPIVRRPVLLR